MALSLKSVRLSSDRRERILAYARTLIDCPEERQQEEAAHAALLDRIRSVLAGFTTPEEYGVLKKFGYTQEVNGAKFNLPDGRQTIKFCFCPRNVRKPVVRERTGCHRTKEECGVSLETVKKYAENSYEDGWRVVFGPESKSGADLRDDVLRWDDARRAHDDARSAIIQDIRTLVERSSNLQQVADVWAPAADLFEQMGGVPDITDALKSRLDKVPVVRDAVASPPSTE